MEERTEEYVVLQHRTMPDKGICFFTTNTNDPKVEYGYNGSHWYNIVGYADTVEQAQSMCRRHSVYPTTQEIEEHVKQKYKNEADAKAEEEMKIFRKLDK